MRKLMLVLAVAAVTGCGGITKEQYGAKEAEAARYRQAAQDEAGKVAALESKVRAVEEQNATLRGQAGQLEKKLVETSSAKSELELTAAKLKDQSGEYAKLNQELQAKMTIRLDERLLFSENSTRLSPENKRSLDSMAEAIAQLKDKAVIVVGYTDDSEAGGEGAQARRWQLSTGRALEVAKYLVGRGVDPMLIGVAGFGEARPIARNDSISDRGFNRRVEIALTPANLKPGTVELKPATLKTN